MEGCFFMITMKQVKQYIGSRLLVRIPHLSFSGKQVIGIVGENGSGKTTLLELLAGVKQPDEGTIQVNGTVEMMTQFLEADNEASGGEQTKQKIQDVFGANPAVLLADEPTNHLDQQGRDYLKKRMKRFNGILFLVSHDRSFLNDVADRIIEIKDGQVSVYEGNYDDYLEQKKVEHAEHERKYENYLREKHHLTVAIDERQKRSALTKKAPSRMGNSEARLHKRGKGTMAKKALSAQANRMKTRMDKLEKVEQVRERTKIVIPFLEGQVIHRLTVVKGEGVCLKKGHKELLDEACFSIKTGEKTAIIGKNGSGKTSLLQEIIKGNDSLDIAETAVFSYFSQSFHQLEEGTTAFDNVQQTSIHDEQVARDLLAHLLFRGADVEKNVSVLSGGERTKVAIAQMILSRSNVLILDEPTNHLDIHSLEVLEEALKAYQGSVIFVSHDTYFVDAVADTVLEIKGKKLVSSLDTLRLSSKEQKSSDEKLLLDMRKSSLITQLSLSLSQEEKRALEKEFQQVVEQLKSY